MAGFAYCAAVQNNDLDEAKVPLLRRHCSVAASWQSDQEGAAYS